MAVSTSVSVKRIGMSEKDKALTDNIPKDGDRGQDAALQDRIEVTVERALTKALNPVVTTLQEATKAAASTELSRKG